MERTKNHEPTEEEWRILARQARDENDPDKMIDLAQRIVEAHHQARAKTRIAVLWPRRD